MLKARLVTVILVVQAHLDLHLLLNYYQMKAHAVWMNSDKIAVAKETETAVVTLTAAVDSLTHFLCRIEHLLMCSVLLINCSKCAVFVVKLMCANFPLISHFDLANAWNARIDDSYRDSKLAVKQASETFARFFVLAYPAMFQSYLEFFFNVNLKICFIFCMF